MRGLLTMAWYRSMLMALRCSMDTVQKVTSRELYTWHEVAPNGHHPVSSFAALGIITISVTQRSATEREARKKFEDCWRVGLVRRAKRTSELLMKEKEMMDIKTTPERKKFITG